jgi:hypothetical protein
MCNMRNAVRSPDLPLLAEPYFAPTTELDS